MYYQTKTTGEQNKFELVSASNCLYFLFFFVSFANYRPLSHEQFAILLSTSERLKLELFKFNWNRNQNVCFEKFVSATNVKVSVSSTLLTVHEARLHATKRSEPRHSNSMVDQHFHSKLHVWLYRTYMLATERLTNRQQRRFKCPTRLSRMRTVS